MDTDSCHIECSPTRSYLFMIQVDVDLQMLYGWQGSKCFYVCCLARWAHNANNISWTALNFPKFIIVQCHALVQNPSKHGCFGWPGRRGGLLQAASNLCGRGSEQRARGGECASLRVHIFVCKARQYSREQNKISNRWIDASAFILDFKISTVRAFLKHDADIPETANSNKVGQSKGEYFESHYVHFQYNSLHNP